MDGTERASVPEAWLEHFGPRIGTWCDKGRMVAKAKGPHGLGWGVFPSVPRQVPGGQDGSRVCPLPYAQVAPPPPWPLTAGASGQDSCTFPPCLAFPLLMTWSVLGWRGLYSSPVTLARPTAPLRLHFQKCWKEAVPSHFPGQSKEK